LFLKQYRLDGELHGDGGLRDALPLWAAVQLGATHAVGISILHRERHRGHPRKCGVRTLILEPRVRLGSILDTIRWEEAGIRRMIHAGVRDATASWSVIADTLEL
jgi:predicted acylesterase/phospholipase RssA